jgi:hypothetical protein
MPQMIAVAPTFQILAPVSDRHSHHCNSRVTKLLGLPHAHIRQHIPPISTSSHRQKLALPIEAFLARWKILFLGAGQSLQDLIF